MTNIDDKTRKNRRSLLFKCLIGSLVVHGCAAWIYFKDPFLLRFSSNTFAVKPALNRLNLVLEEEKNEQLEETLNALIASEFLDIKPFDLMTPFDAVEIPFFAEDIKACSTEVPGFEIPFLKEKEEQASFLVNDPSLSIPDVFENSMNLEPAPELLLPTSTITLKKPALANAFDHLSLPEKAKIHMDEPEMTAAVNATKEPASFAVKKASSPQELSISSQPVQSTHFSGSLALEIPETNKKALILPKAVSSNSKHQEQRDLLAQRKAFTPEPYSFPIAEEEFSYWSEQDVDLEIKTIEHPDGEGYLFSIKMTPRFEIDSPPLKNNFYFLIDRSNSIEKHRFAVFKKAALRALSYLEPGNTFNIYFFDKKCSQLSEKNLPVSKKSIQKAEEYLEKQEYKGLFAAGDLYSSLMKIIPENVDQEEAHTVILISDGNTSMNLKNQQKALKKWMEKNPGHVSLYAAAVGQGNNLILLDMISSFNHGQLLYSDTHAAFPRKMAKLIMDLQHPIAKDLMLKAIPKNSHANISFYPPNSRLPMLFHDQPYEIVGTIDDMSDFTLCVQGRHGDQWLEVEVPICFPKTLVKSPTLAQKWKIWQAHLSYEEFIDNGNAKHLKKAQSYFAPEVKKDIPRSYKR